MVTGVIVQARLGSTRLPGKVLKRLNGRTVLSHVLERCCAIDGVDIVCCAVPKGAINDAVAGEASRAGVTVFRGSEQDVLDRYYHAARSLGLDVVMRVTSDCPLIDPAVCAAVLALRAETGADYACNNMPPSWPHGLDCEAMTMAALTRAMKQASAPYQREHVTPFIRIDAGANKVNLPMQGDGAAHHRWTLDTLNDLRFLKAVFDRLPAGPRAWSYRAPLSIVDAEPQLAAINSVRERDEGQTRSVKVA